MYVNERQLASSIYDARKTLFTVQVLNASGFVDERFERSELFEFHSRQAVPFQVLSKNCFSFATFCVDSIPANLVSRPMNGEKANSGLRENFCCRRLFGEKSTSN
jgi:hypothetical protein